MLSTTVATTPTGVQLATYQTDHHGPRVLIGARIDGDPTSSTSPPEATTAPATSSNAA